MYDGLTDPLGQSQVLPYLQELSKYGFQFTILSFEKKSRYNKEKDIVREITDKAGMAWVPLSFTANPPVLSKIYDRYKMRRMALKLHKKEKFDMVHCRSYIAAEAGLTLKKKFGVKMIFDMRGFWADERVDNGQWNLKNPFFKRIYQHYKKKEREFLSNADATISLTKAAKNYLLSKPENKDLFIEVIPCCADLEHFDYHKINPGDQKALRSTLEIPQNAKVLTYSGSVGGWYMTREMFSFFKILSAKNPEYVMLILTKDDIEKVKREATATGIAPDKVFVTYSNRPQLPLYLSLSSCSIFFIRNTFSKMASSPTKHAELMGMGIPVICNDIGDTGRIINETQTGIVVNTFSETLFKEVIDKIPGLESVEKGRIRDCAKQIFDLQTGIQNYLSVYKAILKKG